MRSRSARADSYLFFFVLIFVFIFIFIPTTLALTFQLAQGLASQIFGKDRLFFVSFIAGRSGLKVETQGAACHDLQIGLVREFVPE